MTVYSRALLVGVNEYKNAACELDVARWVEVLEEPAPGPAVDPQNLTVLTGRAATRAAVLDAFRSFAQATARDRADNPEAVGFFLFSGAGWATSHWKTSGICASDGEIGYEDLSAALDEAFPDLARQRDAAAPNGETVTCRLPAPGVLAVLDTASAEGPTPQGATSRCAYGPDASTWKPGEQRQPRLRYHARQIAPQSGCFSWESAASGTPQGEITRWFAPYFARHHASLKIFGQEIGPGASGLVALEIRDANQQKIGICVWTGVVDVNVLGETVPAERARWHMAAFPLAFTLDPIAQLAPGWSDRPPCLDAKNVPFVTPTQAVAAPTWTRVYAVSAEPGGANLGLMGFSGPASEPTDQWWAAPFGAIDNHGFFVHCGSMRFQNVPLPQTIPTNWRVVKTL